jgi:hypothetical protein
MKDFIINEEKALINELTQNLRTEILTIESELKSSKPNTPFTDSLSRSFYGGKVGFMNKKDNARKSRELNKTIEHSKKTRSLYAQILSLNKKLKKLETGRYIMRKNGLLVESYAYLMEKLNTIEEMLKTGKIKGVSIDDEQKASLKEMKKEIKAQINKRQKMYAIPRL